MTKLHDVLDEVMAEPQSGGYELNVEGRIRLLGFRRITAENRLAEALLCINDAMETLRSRHIDNGTLERLEAFMQRLHASGVPVRTQWTLVLPADGEKASEEVVPDPA